MGDIKKRQSNFELLRVIAMLMIISHHFIQSTDMIWQFPTDVFSPIRVWFQILLWGGRLGVNLFVLISGYFLVKTKFSIFRLTKLWVQILTYSVVVYLIFAFMGEIDFSIKGFIKCFVPVISGKWWFATTYFMLVLMSPFLNILLRHLDKKNFRLLIITLFICWVLVYTFTQYNFECSNFTWFVFLYIIAGYIRLYKPCKQKISKYVFLVILFACLIVSFIIVSDILGIRFNAFRHLADTRYEYRFILVFGMSISLFLLSKNLNIRINKIINIVASTTFGVYLLHAGLTCSAEFLAKNFYTFDAMNSFSYSFGYSLLVIFSVFVACSLIELFRLYVIQPIYIKQLKSLSYKLEFLFRRILYSKFVDKFF